MSLPSLLLDADEVDEEEDDVATPMEVLAAGGEGEVCMM